MMRKSERCPYLLSQAQATQKEAVMAHEPLVVVGAGAGTGKTRTLAWRFCWLVASGKAKGNEILTLTFTEKAAQEMNARIRLTLVQWEEIARAHGDSEVAIRLREALAQESEFVITTIHAFAYSLVRKGGVFLPERDVSNRVVRPAEEAAFWGDCERALDAGDGAWFRSHLPLEWVERVAVLAGEEWESLLEEFGPGLIAQSARDISETFTSRGLRPEVLWEWGEYLEEKDRAPGEDIRSLFLPEWKKEHTRWRKDILPFLDCSGQSGRVPEAIDRLKSSVSLSTERFLFCLSAELSGITRSHRHALYQEVQKLLAESGGGENVAAYRKELDKRWRSALEFLSDTQAARNDRVLRRLLLRGVAVLWKVWEERKKQWNIVSFADQIALACRIVEKNPHLVADFREILIDEFQDTDHLQDNLVGEIARRNKGNLFIVGDIKQSIYRFRHADFSLFGKYFEKAEQEEKGRVVFLDQSYRTVRPLLKEINSLFEYLWKDGVSYRVHHAYRPLKPVLAEMEERECLGIKISFKEHNEPRRMEEHRVFLARALADELSTLRANEGYSWRDMVVLCPTRTYFSALEEALVREKAIPVSFLSNVSYFRRFETADAAALLRFMVDPGDSLSFASFLSSHFSLLSLEQVHRFLEKAQDTQPQERELLFKSTFPHLAEKFEHWRTIARLQGPGAALGELLRETAAFSSFPTAVRRRSYLNICRMVDIAWEYEAVWGKDSAGCAQYLEQASRMGERREEITPVGENEDVVRVMTIHAAKGLEFPVVALFGLEKEARSSGGSSLTVSSHLGVASGRFPISLGEKKQKPLCWDLHHALERKDEEEELERLFYVACTRAQKKLYLCGVCPLDEEGNPTPAPSSPLAWVSDWLGEKGKTLEDYTVNSSPNPLKTEEKTHHSKTDRRSFPLLTLPAGDCLENLSATSFALMRFCPYAWRLRYRQGIPLAWELPAVEEAGGADLGTLLHWVLSRWDFDRSTLETFFPLEPAGDAGNNEIPPLLIPLWPEKKVWEESRRWLVNFSEGQTGRVLREALLRQELQREAPFRFLLRGGPYLRGRIDAMITQKQEIRILDYKITGSHEAPSCLFHDQLVFYGLAVRRFFTGKNLTLQVAFLREGRLEGVSHPASWEEVEEAVQEVSVQAVRGPFLPNHANCPICPWRFRCEAVK